MNKEQLAQNIADKKGITKKEALDNVNDVLKAIKDALVSGDRVALVNFGNFEVRERKERIGRNPQTGQEMKIPKQKNVSFKAGKELRESVKV